MCSAPGGFVMGNYDESSLYGLFGYLVTQTEYVALEVHSFAEIKSF